MVALDGLSDGEREQLRRLLLALADTKLVLGYLMRERVALSPSMEDANGLQGMAAGEFGQAYQLFDLTGRLGADVDALERRSEPGSYSSIEVLDRPPGGWPEFLAVVSLTDLATQVRLATLAGSSWDDLSGLAAKALQEEQFHLGYCAGTIAASEQAAGSFGPAFRRRAAEVAQPVLRWFGPPTPERARLAALGLVPTGPSDERRRLLERMGDLGLDPPEGADAGVDWSTGSAVWHDWDPHRGRARSGGPDPVAVEALRIKDPETAAGLEQPA